VNDPQWYTFLEFYHKVEDEIKATKDKKRKNFWIIKPGEYSNRGCGITVQSTLEMIEEEISTEIYRKKGQLRTYIL